MTSLNSPWDWLLPLDQQPGRLMHFGWWAFAGLNEYQQLYAGNANISLQRHIDGLLRIQLGLKSIVYQPENVPDLWRLTPEKAQKIVLAQGIVLAATHGLLFQRRLSTLLAPWFSSHEMTLLAAIIPADQQLGLFCEDSIADDAMNMGVQALNTLFFEHPVWQRLRLHWCPPVELTFDHVSNERLEQIFSRLMRIL